jgi:hypothetical protein
MNAPPALHPPHAPSSALRRHFPILFVGLLACLASLALYALPTARPILIVDDFQIVFRSWTWTAAWDHLWDPANEHAMPLGRISTAVLATAAGWRPTVFLQLAGLQGPLALVLGMILVGIFVSRELGHSFYGLVAMALFGVSTVYQQAIYWYSASFSVLALDTFLLGLLAAQHTVRTNRIWPLAFCLLACALAPAWFASGILAGPMCALYLLAHAVLGPAGAESRPALAYRLLSTAAPILGTAAFLAVSLPLTADKIMHLHHYGDKTAIEVFDPLDGLVSTCRSVVDNLALGVLGISEVMCPAPWVAIPFSALFCLAAWWTWWAPHKPLVVLGLGLVLTAYMLVYSARPARAGWPYEHFMWHSNWSRYHLLPQLGLALFVVGGLPRWHTRVRLDPAGGLSRWQVCALVVLIGTLILIQLPRGILAHWTVSRSEEAQSDAYSFPLPRGYLAEWRDARIHAEQVETMRRIEAVDALCREHHIDAAVARRVLGPIRMTYDAAGDPQNESNWQFLRGSRDPRSISDEEARRILQPAARERSGD